MKVVLWFTVLLLIVGALIGLRMLQLNGAFESKPVASNVAPPANADPYLMLPLPDPDSDVIFGSDNADTSIVRYSPREGFWAREQKVSPSIGLFNLEDGHYLFSVNGPFSDVIVAEDLEWSRPWAPASVTHCTGSHTAHHSTHCTTVTSY